MKKQFQTLSHQKGMTLIEILVALVLFAAISAAIIPQVLSNGERGKIKTTGISMSTLENALSQYKLEYGTKKMQNVTLDDLVAQKFIPSIPLDGWKNELYFEMDGSNILIISNGPDGESDTADDISNQDSE
ncbi:MAG: type II secretion system protein GspG [Saccharospirillaceae bacterium]|nr:type II secretion system protein GspG [Pseudomonadales bacterium]NRB80531.1 type II secretion system protein GspG [Saccharospirillaceae bacterium]